MISNFSSPSLEKLKATPPAEVLVRPFEAVIRCSNEGGLRDGCRGDRSWHSMISWKSAFGICFIKGFGDWDFG